MRYIYKTKKNICTNLFLSIAKRLIAKAMSRRTVKWLQNNLDFKVGDIGRTIRQK